MGIIIASSVGIPMLEGFAEGVSGSPDPTIRIRATTNGNSLNANAYNSKWGVSSMGYPRLITNGDQINFNVSAYDTAGITSLQVRFVKNTETNYASYWSTYGSNVQEISYQNYSPYSNWDEKTYSYTLTPGRYIIMARATTTDGRYSYKYNYIEYGIGDLIGTDFQMATRDTSTGRLRFCALYDLSKGNVDTVGVDTNNCSLMMTRVGHNPPFNYVSTDLNITMDSTNSRRYLVTGTVDPNAFSYLPGTYRTWLNATRKNGTSYTIYYPDFTW